MKNQLPVGNWFTGLPLYHLANLEPANKSDTAIYIPSSEMSSSLLCICEKNAWYVS